MPERVLSSSDMTQLQAALDAQRGRTAEQVAALQRDLDMIVEGSNLATPDDEHDPEGATVGFERAQVASLLGRARSRLADLDRAAERLAAGSYGVCLRCRGPIEVERLTALPAAPSCVACATRPALSIRRAGDS
jgi:DnaK suppressor protein